LQQIQHHAAALEQKAREKTPITSNQVRREGLAQALAQAVALNPFAEILPAIAALSHADKFQLVQIVLTQLAQEDSIKFGQIQQPTQPFSPRSFFGVTHQPKQVIDDYLTSNREGWL
jgi:NAD-specific glutamate dehydrogenase